ncbi:MAG: protein kinase [Deltaproteobacteria bacterium]|nr:protein kinase [Deltaproteobacteria bacterium]
MATDGPTLPAPFGRYQLLERLAVGGMAEIFKAKISGAHGFEKTVVIKRILPHLASDPSFLQMFITEAKVTVELVHPKIVQVFEFGDVEGQLYIALEFVDGLDCLALLRACAHRRARLPARLAVHIGAEILDALDYAHHRTNAAGEQLGIVHRDISPSNVFLSRRGDVKLGDFGIARVTERTSKTQAGTLKGKYGYMSPEQVIGGDLDGRSDIFSVGIVLAEMLMGRRLFVAPGDLDVLLMVRDARLDRLDKYGADIEPELRSIVVRTLLRNPADRFETAGECRDALLDWLMLKRWRVSAADVAGFLVGLQESAPVAPAPALVGGAATRPAAEAGISPSAAARASLPTKPATPAPSAVLAVESLAIEAEPPGPTPEAADRPSISRARPGAAPTSAPRFGHDAPWPQVTPRTTPRVQVTPAATAEAQLAFAATLAIAESSEGCLTPTGLDDLPTPPPRVGSAGNIDDAIKIALEDEMGPTPVHGVPILPPPPPRPAPAAAQSDDIDIPIVEAPLEGTSSAPSRPLGQDEEGAYIEIGDGLEVLDAGEVSPYSTGRFPPVQGSIEPPVYGDLEVTSPAKLFSRVAVARETGLVVVECGGVIKEVYIVGGAPEFVTSNLAHELLGEYLTSQGVISAGEQSMALAMMPRFGGKLGDTLVGLGLMRPLDVFRHLTRQVRAKLVDIFSWQRGRYRWERNRCNTREAFPLGLDAFEIIGAGVVTLPLAYLRARYRAFGDRMPRGVEAPPVAPEAFRLGPGPRELYQRLDGHRRLDEWTRLFPSDGELLNFYRTLYLLVEAGLVEL